MMISREKARELFEAKMRWVEEQTGEDIRIGLIMKCGPDDAIVVYEQMFACFWSGMETGINHMKVTL